MCNFFNPNVQCEIKRQFYKNSIYKFEKFYKISIDTYLLCSKETRSFCNFVASIIFFFV